MIQTDFLQEKKKTTKKTTYLLEKKIGAVYNKRYLYR